MSTPPFADLDRTGQLGRVFAASAVIAFTASALGYAACLRTGAVPAAPGIWLAFALAALAASCVAAVLLERAVLAPARRLRTESEAVRRRASAQEQELAERAEQQRRLRHDLRGALSPVLLVSDRLLAHADPAVKRSGDIMVRAVERATALLAEPGGPVSPPSDS